ncbi:YlxR family protein [Mycoplasma sp. AC1221]|uniref:YlxR family protein n=1 Tax=Mycoplasma sp. 6243 TaxID=3440865 RepID=UPI003EC0C5A5
MMNENLKNFNRKCIATNQIVNVKEMLRFDFNRKANTVILDKNQNMKGRGAYFIPSFENWNKIRRTKALNRTFRTNVTKETYDDLESQIQEVINVKENTSD